MTGTGDRWFFDRIAGLYDLFMFGADADALRDGLAHAERDVERVVDVAGGTGRASAVIDAPERLAVDVSVPMLGQAAERGLTAVAGDAAGLPLPDASVDAVVVADALHHLPDVDAALSEAARVLRPGGVLVVRDFDPETWVGRAIELGEGAIGMESTFFPPSAVADRIEQAGLDAAVPAEGRTYTVVGVRG